LLIVFFAPLSFAAVRSDRRAHANPSANPSAIAHRCFSGVRCLRTHDTPWRIRVAPRLACGSCARVAAAIDTRRPVALGLWWGCKNVV